MLVSENYTKKCKIGSNFLKLNLSNISFGILKRHLIAAIYTIVGPDYENIQNGA